MNVGRDRSSGSRNVERCCGGGSPCGGPGIDRRSLLKLAGAGVSALAAPRPAGAAQGDAGTAHLVPADKQLSPAWVAALAARGEPEVFKGKDLATLAMPIGGIGTGQLYLLGDGTLAGWSIFNRHEFSGHGSDNYNANRPTSPVEQGFAVVAESGGQKAARRLNVEGFPGVAFRGEYPIGKVTYARDGFPLTIEMEAFSPFIPLRAKDSGIPATVFNLTIRNTSGQPVRVHVLGWLANAVCVHSAPYVHDRARRTTRIASRQGRTTILHAAREVPLAEQPPARPAIVLADFEGETYGNWKAEGAAPGSRPATGPVGQQSPIKGVEGRGFVNTYSGTDEATGRLVSPAFEISRRFINLKVGGGKDAQGRLAVRLIVDGQAVRSVAGEDEEQLKWKSWRVDDLAGRRAHLEIVDDRGGGWGHINVDQIELSDECRTGPRGPIPKLDDFGTMALTLAGEAAAAPATRELLGLLGEAAGKFSVEPEAVFDLREPRVSAIATRPVALGAGADTAVTFVVSWCFPNRQTQESDTGQMYANRFADAAEAADSVLEHRERLFGETRRWRDTYYDSTLPWWLLDRLHSTISTLATNTCQWWRDGRFWAWEGVFCCYGTCTHVWNYAHGAARLFPELERSVRTMQDLGAAFHENGLVGFRGNDAYAADGQAGTILKCYREHQTSGDDSFLKAFWPKIRKALEYSMVQDGNDDGLIENSQHNTFDINFVGANTFVGSLYLAALRAGEEMAREAGDAAFAERARRVFEAGSRLSAQRLFNGEYFAQEVDLAAHPKYQYGQGCLSDQLFGQGWAEQLDLGPLYPREKVRTALASIWKYNWAPDVGPHNARHAPGRWFARPGEGGLFVCTWPRSEHLPRGVLYQNEVWTGGEYQVAGHMIREGMVTEGLSICRAIHERYHPSKHNPYNEVECGDHYARALASWGVYLALVGYRYHGPKGFIGFGPRITPDDFRAAFTAAEGWGTFSQKRAGGVQTERIEVTWGRLRVRTLAFDLPAGQKADTVTVRLGETAIDASHEATDGRVTIRLAREAVVETGGALAVAIA